MEARTAPESAPAAGSALLERGSELERLADAFTAARAGRGSVVVVDGGAGLGKSQLLDAAALLAREHELQALTAAGRELERDFTFGITLQLLETRVAEASPDEAARLLSGPARLAAPLLSPGPRAALPDEGDAFSLLHGLYRLCANLAEAAPLALLVDDAHWADPASLRFVLYLAHRVAELPTVPGPERRPARARARSARAGRARRRVQRPSRSCSSRSTRRRCAQPSASPSAAPTIASRASATAPPAATPSWWPSSLRELVNAGVEPSAGSAGAISLATPESVVRWVALRLARMVAGSRRLRAGRDRARRWRRSAPRGAAGRARRGPGDRAHRRAGRRRRPALGRAAGLRAAPGRTGRRGDADAIRAGGGPSGRGAAAVRAACARRARGGAPAARALLRQHLGRGARSPTPPAGRSGAASPMPRSHTCGGRSRSRRHARRWPV